MRAKLHSMMACFGALALAACATTSTHHATAPADPNNGAYASTYTPRPSVPTLIRGGTVFDGNGATLQNADVKILPRQPAPQSSMVTVST